MSQNYLYLLTESDYDDDFFNYLLEDLIGVNFEPVLRRLRRGGGVNEVNRVLPTLLQNIKGLASQQNEIYFLITMDNDRHPRHPGHPHNQYLKYDRDKSKCRFCEIKNLCFEILGRNRNQWPIKGFYAVPVEMIEAWMLLMVAPVKYKLEDDLPIFSRKSDEASKFYRQFRRGKIPGQLKELWEQERQSWITSGGELEKIMFYFHCIDEHDPNDLIKRSPSYELFYNQV